MELQQELVYQEYIHRETETVHAPYNPELAFYIAIRQGNLRAVENNFNQGGLADRPGLGTLSDKPLQSLKYHFAITAALISRYCIEGGMEHTSAYTLSDFYIRKADQCKDSAVISKLHYTMCTDYAKRMQKLHNNQIDSIHVRKCLDYIYDHLHTKILINDLADLVHLSPNYLSRLFHAETGYTISNYIQHKKIETAQNMLLYSEYSPAEIAHILAFPNQSYFSSIFKKHTGMTPSSYQSGNIRSTSL